MGLWLMIGITVIAVLLATSIPKYKSLLLKTKESVLENNLLETRLVIKQYINDKQQAPHSLQDLVDAGYFRNLPTDPITKSNSSWRPVIETVSSRPEEPTEASRICIAGRVRSHPKERFTPSGRSPGIFDCTASKTEG
jgi:type II secretory pathway pseudopilin PulG